MSDWPTPPIEGIGYAFISLRSVNFPDHYVRHQNFLGELSPIVSDLDRHDASFYNEFALDKQEALLLSMRSVNYPTRYWRHFDFRLRLDEPPASGPNSPEGLLFAQDATFLRLGGFVALNTFSYRSVNYPDRYIRHRDFHLYLEQVTEPVLDFAFTEVPAFVKGTFPIPPVPPRPVWPFGST